VPQCVISTLRPYVTFKKQFNNESSVVNYL